MMFWATMMGKMMLLTITVMVMMIGAYAGDTNPIYSPCSDTKVKVSDGFTFGVAFSSKDSFFFNQTQLSPCDRRLSMSGNKAQLALFRPKVDEISLLTVSLDASTSGGYMVAFAGSQYAARSSPIFVADNSNTVTSFTLVLDFKKGVLNNLYWTQFGCGSCGRDFVCLNNTQCAVPNSKCKSKGGPLGCDIGIQTVFSGTDQYDTVLNSWYEVDRLRKKSLYGLYASLKDTLTSPF